jgi:fatty acid synthase subunit alpha, fungi type
MQWTGGRAGGHHSFEDFHQPILATYSSIRCHNNIALVVGSRFGGSEDTWPYLSGDWWKQFGVEPMPFDGFLFGSRVMVDKEAHTSPSVKGLIVAAAGVDDAQWEGPYVGGIIIVRSELASFVRSAEPGSRSAARPLFRGSMRIISSPGSRQRRTVVLSRILTI